MDGSKLNVEAGSASADPLNSAEPDVYKAICPSREIQALIGEKWSSLIVGALYQNTLRFGQLRRRCEGVSQKVLTKTLRRLERDGMVIRVEYPDEMVLRVEYSLTAIGESLVPVVQSAKRWAEQNLKRIEQHRTQYEQQHQR